MKFLDENRISELWQAVKDRVNSLIPSITTAQQTANTATEAAETAQNSADNAQSTANTAKATAEAALPLSGGTMTGPITGITMPTVDTGAASKIYVDSHIINPNLLDNWYFGNPANQRASSEYNGAKYTIDRWKSNSSTGKLNIENTGVRITATESTSVYYIQIFEKNLPVDTYTFSALVSECTGSGYIQFIYSDNTNGPALNINGTGLFSFTANANKAIIAIFKNLNNRQKPQTNVSSRFEKHKRVPLR